MPTYATDTHSILWHLTLSTRLSPTAAQLFDEADSGRHIILIPAIVLIETTYLCEKGKVPRHCFSDLVLYIRENPSNYRVAPLDLQTSLYVSIIPRQRIPNMPDRIIAATALRYNVPLITKDEHLYSYKMLATVW